MQKPRVLVMGATGMLGSMVLDVLDRDERFEVVATSRGQPLTGVDCEWRELDVSETSTDNIAKVCSGCDWVVNAIGVIKQRINESDPEDVEAAIRVNGLFPFLLGRSLAEGTRCITIATDCVYSGRQGGYVESDQHDPLDVYGKSKSLGEVTSAGVINLRCSIVGPQQSGNESLYAWFASRPDGAEVTGYTNHRWNGVTTLHFAKVCAGLISSSNEIPRQHLVPRDAVTKSDLLEIFRAHLDRRDITIVPGRAAEDVDRTLDTAHPEQNRKLWEDAGYDGPPSIDEMVEELAAFDYRWDPLRERRPDA